MSVNANGFSNRGFRYYLDAYVKRAWNKPFCISIAFMGDVRETIAMIEACDALSIPMVELNASCPNVATVTNLDQLLDAIDQLHLRNVTIGLKLPLLFGDEQLNDVVKRIKAHSWIAFVTCGNTIPHGYVPGVIKANGGYGGIGGAPCKPIALSNVRRLRVLLPSNVTIIGCGGVSSAIDVQDYLQAGASLVQIGTALREEGLDVFQRVGSPLRARM